MERNGSYSSTESSEIGITSKNGPPQSESLTFGEISNCQNCSKVKEEEQNRLKEIAENKQVGYWSKVIWTLKGSSIKSKLRKLNL